jgi:hypothetical protein
MIRGIFHGCELISCSTAQISSIFHGIDVDGDGKAMYRLLNVLG